MKILRLEAENVKRLKAVEIVPRGDTILLTGRNAQGKSSVLDAIWYALGGRSAEKGVSRPVRDGESRAHVTLDLGTLIVTRTWREDGASALTVTDPEGAPFRTPQAILDELTGRFAFDPLEFLRLKEKDQVSALLETVPLSIDLDETARRRKALYDERTLVGRTLRDQEGALAELPLPDPDLPLEELSASAILAELQAAQKTISENERKRRELERLREDASRLRAEVEDLERRLAAKKAELASLVERGKAAKDVVAALRDPDTAELEARLADLEATNARIREAAKYATLQGDVLRWRAEYARFTEEIEALDRAKAEALAAAVFPVPGLGFDEEGVTLNGVPLKQASQAEQLRVSVGVAMSLNPELRVLRIQDGSLLDSDSLAVLEHAAREKDYQLWIECVDESGSVGVYIEDGEVKAVDGVPVPPKAPKSASSENTPSTEEDPFSASKGEEADWISRVKARKATKDAAKSGKTRRAAECLPFDVYPGDGGIPSQKSAEAPSGDAGASLFEEF